MKKKVLLSVLLLITIYNFGFSQPKGNSAHPPSNASWTGMLKKYVNQSGWVNYKEWKNDRGELDPIP